MGQPIVHFEIIIGPDPHKLRSFCVRSIWMEIRHQRHGGGAPISEPGNYGFVNRDMTDDGVGIPGGVGGGPGYHSHAIFCVGVPNVGIALEKSERLGATRVMGPVKSPGKNLRVAHFTDAQGNLIGLAGPA